MRATTTALRAAATFGGTLAVMGGATVAVSAVTSAAIRAAVRARQRPHLTACRECDPPGTGKRRCGVCRGGRAVAWTPAGAPRAAEWTLCPLCGGDGDQSCWNCKGSGEVVGDTQREG